MPEVAGRPLGATLEAAAVDDAGADAGGDFHEEEVGLVAPGCRLLAEREEVDVVVDEDGHEPEGAADVGRDVEAVPSGHDRGIDRHAGRMLDRSGHTDADADQVVARAARVGDESFRGCECPVEHGLGAVCDGKATRLAFQDRAGEVGDGDHAVRRTEVDGDDHARLGLERDARRRAAPGGDSVAGGADEAGGRERIDTGRDRRAGEAR